MIAEAAYTSADLTFNAEAHLYTRPDGCAVPSVTQILSAVGISTDFDELRASSRRIAEAIDEKRDIGTALHADAHAFDDKDLDWSTVDPRVLPYLRAYETFRANTGLKPLTRERLVYHPVFGYAGTFDGLFLRPDGVLVLIDIKTGDPNDSGCQFQTAAYLAAYQHERGKFEKPFARWGVQLTPQHKVPYRIHQYAAWDDFHKFQAFLVTYNHQAVRRSR